jgi:hypothetical protein
MSVNAEWIEILRAACAGATQSAVGQRIGYSAAVVNQVLKGTYKGDLNRVQKAAEGALMGSTVDCPVVGDMPRQRCIEHQRSPLRTTNPMALQLHHACRNGCPNSLIKTGHPAGKDSA